MPSSRYPLWFLLGLPLLELYLIVKLGGRFGFVTILLWVLVSGALGVRILQSRSWTVVNRVQQAIAAGQSPGRELLDTAVVIIGAVLLIVPGFITDALALPCLLPPTRARIARYIEERFMVVTPVSGHEAPPQTIEGEYRREN